MEQPFRVFTREALKYLPTSAATKAKWELTTRPAYLLGVLEGARQAQREKITRITVIEFGVAGGTGLLELERISKLVEKETGVNIEVVGFDMGPDGLPELCGDHKDHPDKWQAGDYPMDFQALLPKIDKSRTKIVLGNVKNTVSSLYGYCNSMSHVGFVAFDLDLYSSTVDAMEIFHRNTLLHVPLYFDDIEYLISYKEAGELKAIEDFNKRYVNDYFIDKWYGVKEGRPFPERGFLDKMYVFHDCSRISKTTIKRSKARLELTA